MSEQRIVNPTLAGPDKRTVSDPSGVRHKLDWNHRDWMNRTVCGHKSNLANGWLGVPTEWSEDCEACFEG